MCFVSIIYRYCHIILFRSVRISSLVVQSRIYLALTDSGRAVISFVSGVERMAAAAVSPVRQTAKRKNQAMLQTVTQVLAFCTDGGGLPIPQLLAVIAEYAAVVGMNECRIACAGCFFLSLVPTLRSVVCWLDRR